MLLDSNEIKIEGGEYRLLEFVFVRVYLRGIGPPSPTVPCFATVELGSCDALEAPIRVQTNAFQLSDVRDHTVAYRTWTGACRRGYEKTYVEFLLCHLRETSEVQVSFWVEGGEVTKIFVTLSNIRLEGRFPPGVNILPTHFECLTLSET